MLSNRRKTFLEIISESIPEPVSEFEQKIIHQLEQLIFFESQIAYIYFNLMEYFSSIHDAKSFFSLLSYQEKAHTEILRIVKVEISRRKLWDSVKLIDPAKLDKAHLLIQSIQHQMSQPAFINLQKALEFVEKIESEESTIIFDFLLHFYNVVQTPFLKKIHRIIPSFADHHEFLNSQLPILKELAKY